MIGWTGSHPCTTFILRAYFHFQLTTTLPNTWAKKTNGATMDYTFKINERAFPSQNKLMRLLLQNLSPLKGVCCNPQIGV